MEESIGKPQGYTSTEIINKLGLTASAETETFYLSNICAVVRCMANWQLLNTFLGAKVNILFLFAYGTFEKFWENGNKYVNQLDVGK